MDYGEVPRRLAAVRERIARAQARGGFVHPVTIIGVTKGHGPEAVQAATLAGLADVGENRVQEALAKQEAVGSNALAWHLIGSLQRVLPDDDDAADEIGSLSQSAEALRITAAAPVRNTSLGGDYEG